LYTLNYPLPPGENPIADYYYYYYYYKSKFLLSLHNVTLARLRLAKMFIMHFNKRFCSITQHTTQQPKCGAYKNNTLINRGKETFALLTEYVPTRICFMTGERQTCAVTFTTLPVHKIAFRGQILISRRGPWFFKDVQSCGRERDLWRSVAVGWTGKLHATAGRYVNRGSEDVKLGLTTMGAFYQWIYHPIRRFSIWNCSFMAQQ
jgi:hypothetical protein